jgi:hypothetical protein
VNKFYGSSRCRIWPKDPPVPADWWTRTLHLPGWSPLVSESISSFPHSSVSPKAGMTSCFWMRE